jgi:predicted TIM-barrel fold metal-dependent hydrolase
MFDCHIHMMDDTNKEEFFNRVEESCFTGGLVFSRPPKTFDGNSLATGERLESVIRLVEGKNEFHPFYWIDPLEADACQQVDDGVSLGIEGFKIISMDDYPNNPRAMEVYRRIAYHDKPILFHSGILWNGKNSSNFNRPANFECLLDVDNLRFALAHVSWPWHDECLAVFGKFIEAKRFGKQNTMYIDLTPGTPEIYRKEVLTKLFQIGYEVDDFILWGTDNHSENYDVGWAKKWQKIDSEIFDQLSLTPIQKEKIFVRNLEGFLK